MGSLKLEGKNEKVKAFEPLSEATAASEATAHYREAYDLMEAEDPAAAEAFARLLEAYPDDKLVGLHARRLAAGEAGTIVVIKGT